MRDAIRRLDAGRKSVLASGQNQQASGLRSPEGCGRYDRLYDV